MNAVLDVPTVYICTGITFLVMAGALSVQSVYDRRERATRWWAAAMWVGFAGLCVLASRTVMPAWFALGIGNTLLTATLGLGWAGFVVFTGGKLRLLHVFAGAITWAACFGGLEAFRSDVTYRILLNTAILAAYSGMIVHVAWKGWQVERLPAFIVAIWVYGFHGFVYLARGAASMLIPATETAGTINAPWIPFFTLEGFAISILGTLVFTALIKERAERKYRLAAEIDSLTASATRRFFVAETRDRLAKSPKSGVLAIIDLDFFKSVNDCYGHLGGDRVLAAFGKFVNNRLRPGMEFGRLGGEEFGIFLPDMEASEAREWLDTLRSDVEAMQIPFMGSPIRITISVGAASVREAGVDFDHLMAAADGALYLAKEEGRNRLRMFSLTMRMHQIVEDGAEIRLGLTEQRLSRMNIRSRVGGA